VNSQPRQRDDFWAEIEAEIGETILIRCLAQYLAGNTDHTEEFWGLFFVTETAAYLRTVPPRGWQARLKSLAGVGVDTEEEPRQTRVPLRDIDAIELEKPDSLWQRIIRPYPKEHITIRWANAWFTIAPDASVDQIAEAIHADPPSNDT
jgi:hypothetical protein